MHRLILALFTLAALTVMAAGVARADENSSGGCTPTGPALVVCYGNSPCPKGYQDPVGANQRNIPGLAGQNIMVAPSRERWVCQLINPYTETLGPRSESAEARPPSPSSASSEQPTASASTSAPTSDATSASTSDATSAAAPPVPATSIVVANSPTLGAYLTTPAGMALYTRSSDSAGVSTCTASCAIIWLPFQPPSSGSPSLPSDATGTIGVILRDDGAFQLTYNGMPLYTYTGDLKPGDTSGNGIGGVYQVAKP